MARPTLTICTTCRASKHAPEAAQQRARGEDLWDAVKALRKEQGLKDVFKLESIRCLRQCDQPCALVLSGKKRSTYLRVAVNALDPQAVLDAACRYAQLSPGQELPERLLPGESGD